MLSNQLQGRPEKYYRPREYARRRAMHQWRRPDTNTGWGI